jgi:hypothetical protein
MWLDSGFALSARPGMTAEQILLVAHPYAASRRVISLTGSLM